MVGVTFPALVGGWCLTTWWPQRLQPPAPHSITVRLPARRTQRRAPVPGCRFVQHRDQQVAIQHGSHLSEKLRGPRSAFGFSDPIRNPAAARAIDHGIWFRDDGSSCWTDLASRDVLRFECRAHASDFRSFWDSAGRRGSGKCGEKMSPIEAVFPSFGQGGKGGKNPLKTSPFLRFGAVPKMAAPIRFERTTFPLGGGRSIQLSYGARHGASRTRRCAFYPAPCAGATGRAPPAVAG